MATFPTNVLCNYCVKINFRATYVPRINGGGHLSLSVVEFNPPLKP